jgi:hypothetical protein
MKSSTPLRVMSLMRFERTTFRLGGGRSILLSYRDICDFFTLQEPSRSVKLHDYTIESFPLG